MSLPAPDAARPRARFVRRFLRQPLPVIALAYLLLVTLVAVFAPWLAPLDPARQNLSNVLGDPGGEHLLGTDELGRDVLSRLLMGSRVSLLAAVQGTLVALAIGVPVGLVAGYFRGGVDRVIMVFTDAVMSLPGLVLAMAIVAIWGPNLTNAMIAIGIVVSPQAIRLVRSSVLQIREETYVEASRSIGTRPLGIIARHVLPNAAGPLIVFTALLAGSVMLVEAGLSFIGLGVQPPEASWGAMLGTSFRYLSRAPELALYPGLAIATTVLALNLVGDGVRDSIGKRVSR